MLEKMGNKIIERTEEIAGKLKENKNGTIFAITVLSIGAIVAGVVVVAGKAIDSVAVGGDA